ncbi:ABC transporter ATP-binding protein [Roseomonas sp. 18066]|uniref:ABC transporter ATP-binding protein n=1 Tax=Roseomonas sp. 18066 TaxID=2681412 RepID=UPI00190FAE0A|nr:ATP-binding cassette domain-containing protein [Roseomonas sp. 18066]
MRRGGLRVERLAVRGAAGPILHDVSFAVEPGGTFILLGESGSGKSLVLHALMGTLPPGLQATGRAFWGETELLALPPRQRRQLWGREIGLLPQEPWLALDPSMRAVEQVAEVHRFQHGARPAAARRLARLGLAAFGLGGHGGHYPHQLSGGMCQRVALATARAGQAGLFLADEPTKGLDAARVDEVALGLQAAAADGQTSVVVTHDLALAARLGGEAAVLLEGRLLERGPVAQLVSTPSHDYTRALVGALPVNWPDRAPPPPPGPAVMAGRGLAKSFGGRRLFDGLDLGIAAGQIVAVTGPSGCGKSTLGNMLLGLARPDRGEVRRQPGIAAHRFQKLYQDPPSSFAPHLAVGRGFADLARLHGTAFSAVPPILARLGLAETLLQRPPGQLSGGELQRLSLARSLLLRPVFLFADEPSSRLDPLAQRTVMQLLAELAAEEDLAVLLVTHDEAIAAKMASIRLRL